MIKAIQIMIEGKIEIESEKTEVDQMIGQDHVATTAMIGGGDDNMIAITMTMVTKFKMSIRTSFKIFNYHNNYLFYLYILQKNSYNKYFYTISNCHRIYCISHVLNLFQGSE